MKGFLLGSTCLVMVLAWTNTASAQEVRVEIYTDYYTPRYYNDYPVFYDDGGVPFYYVNGVVHYVPQSYVDYHVLRRHYRSHRRHYGRWYRARGHRFHGYRRIVYSPLYHNGYTVYYDDAGLPYYWTGARRYYVPRHHARYRVYRNHYGRHRGHYRRWHRRHGHRRYRHSASVRHHRRAGPAPRRVGRRHHPGYRPRHGRPHRGYGHGRVDCRRNPGHPACRRGGPPRGVRVRHGGPSPRRGPRGGGHHRRRRHR